MTRSYTSAKREHAGEKPAFAIDGVTFVCEGGVSMLDISEFAKVAKAGVNTDDPAAAAVFAEFFDAALGEKVYAQFKRHVRENNTTEDELVDIMKGIIEDFLGRPTKEPLSSQDGPSTTGPTSKVVSLQRGSVHWGQPGSKAAAAVSSPSMPVPSSTGVSSYG
jgi:hypothetical protein